MVPKIERGGDSRSKSVIDAYSHTDLDSTLETSKQTLPNQSVGSQRDSLKVIDQLIAEKSKCPKCSKLQSQF